MSASDDVFDFFRQVAYPLNGAHRREHGTAMPAFELASQLRKAKPAYLAQGGVGEVSDELIEMAIKSIATFCSTTTPTGEGNIRSPRRNALWKLAQPEVKRRTNLMSRNADGRPDLDALKGMIATVVHAARAKLGPHRDDDFEQVAVDFFAWFAGYQLPESQRIPVERMRLTKRERDVLAAKVARTMEMHTIFSEPGVGKGRRTVVTRHRTKAGVTRKVRRERSAALSVSQVHAIHSKKRDGRPAISQNAVRTAMAKVQRNVDRDAKMDGLPSNARDLHSVIDGWTPKGKCSVVDIDHLAPSLFQQARSASSRSNHRKWVRQALKQIQEARLGMSFGFVPGTQLVVVARGRKPPKDVMAFVASEKVRAMPTGLVPLRQGPLGTLAGQDAQSLLRLATDRANDDDAERIVAVLGHEEGGFRNVSQSCGDSIRKDTKGWASRVVSRLEFGIGSSEWGHAAIAVTKLVDKARQSPLAAWKTVVAGPRYGAATSISSKRAISQITLIMSRIRDIDEWEPTFLAAVASSRPGRRHTRPLTDRRPIETRPVPAVEMPSRPTGYTVRVYPATQVEA